MEKPRINRTRDFSCFRVQELKEAPMFEDFSTVESHLSPHVVNAVCDLPALHTRLFWDPFVPSELFTSMEWTSVLLDRIDNGRLVDPSSTTGYRISGRG